MTDFKHQNSNYIDSVSQLNHEVLDHTEDVALGSLYQAISHAIGLCALSAVTAQQQSNITAQAVVTMGATTLYSVVTASDSLFIVNKKAPVSA